MDDYSITIRTADEASYSPDPAILYVDPKTMGISVGLNVTTPEDGDWDLRLLDDTDAELAVFCLHWGAITTRAGKWAHDRVGLRFLSAGHYRFELLKNGCPREVKRFRVECARS